MNQTSSQPSPNEPFHYLSALLTTARRKPGLWFVPLFSVMLIAILTAFLGPKYWDATQSFVVREELIGRRVGPGRFDSLDSMKTAQQVIQETARRPAVLERVYMTVEGQTPSRADIESLRKAISFQAPGGSELGKTEILTVRIESSSPEKAVSLVEALFEETRREIRTQRQRKAASMLTEVAAAVELAQEQLVETTTKMRQMESQAGGDLSELRGLNEAFSGGSDLRRQVSVLDSEIRQTRQNVERANQLIQNLTTTFNDPMELLATPRELLESQPALSKLKDQLIEAQVNQSSVVGVYSVKHPRHIASVKSVNEIRWQIKQELESALSGLRAQKELAEKQLHTLEKDVNEFQSRINKVANMRVDYGQLVSELALRNGELASAEREYAQAASILRAAENVHFMSRLDEAYAGLYPLGPTKKILVLGATLAGLFIGLGFLMMATPTPVGTFNPPSLAAQRAENRAALMPASKTESEQENQRQRQAQTAARSGKFTGAQKASLQSEKPLGGIPGFVIPDLGEALREQTER